MSVENFIHRDVVLSPILCVYNELFEGIERSDFLFVEFGLKDALEQDEFVESDAKVVSTEQDSRLSLDLDCSHVVKSIESRLFNLKKNFSLDISYGLPIVLNLI